MNRLAVALFLVVVVPACGDHTYVAPSGTRDILGRPTSWAPGSVPLGTPGPGLILSGVVSTAQGPVKGADISVWVSQSNSGRHFGVVTTDAQGRYSLNGVPQGFVVMYASRGGYTQPCAATLAFNMNATLNIELVSLDSPLPPRTIAAPTLSGIVFETTEGGRRPIGGVDILMEWLPDLVTATTRTDAEGRYLLCGVPTGHIDVSALKVGYGITDVAVQFQSDAVLDLELKR
jgi:hypothetical protein